MPRELPCDTKQVARLDRCRPPPRILSLSHFDPLSQHATETPLPSASIALGSLESPESLPATSTTTAAASNSHRLSRRHPLTSHPMDGLHPSTSLLIRFPNLPSEIMEPYRPYHAH